MEREYNGSYYINPAFCQKSEFHNCSDKIPSKLQISPRKPPLGAQTPYKELDRSTPEDLNDNNAYEEQDFYEEIFIDDTGIVKEKKIVVVPQSQDEGREYIRSPQYLAENLELKYFQDALAKKRRNEYIPLAKHASTEETVEEIHETHDFISKYTCIDVDEDTKSTTKGRYALVPIEDLQCDHNQIHRGNARMNYIPNVHRYEYIDGLDCDFQNSRSYSRNDIHENTATMLTHNSTQSPIPHSFSSRGTRYDFIQEPELQVLNYGNMTPTQKLHEILSTPKRRPVKKKTATIVLSPRTQRPSDNSPSTPANSDPFITPKKTFPKKNTSPWNPKAQQKLNYSIGSRQLTPNIKKHTAIIAPICSSPVQSVYSETTYSNKTESWMNISVDKPPLQATLAVAALMMVLCGCLSSGMCFYMMSLIGKVYYLEFGIISGFACLTLGILGFRTRHCTWLPNRNYISGYIVLSIFSLLTCGALLILLFMQPRPGTPLADMTSGAVCAISVLSLCLATTGVVSSYCCSVPPPDNRVQHCAQGFIV